MDPDALLDVVLEDHRLRLRKPSAKPPMLLDRECDIEGLRVEDVVCSVTGAGGAARVGTALARGVAEFGRCGGGRSDEVRGSEAPEKTVSGEVIAEARSG